MFGSRLTFTPTTSIVLDLVVLQIRIAYKNNESQGQLFVTFIIKCLDKLLFPNLLGNRKYRFLRLTTLAVTRNIWYFWNKIIGVIWVEKRYTLFKDKYPFIYNCYMNLVIKYLFPEKRPSSLCLPLLLKKRHQYLQKSN